MQYYTQSICMREILDVFTVNICEPFDLDPIHLVSSWIRCFIAYLD